VSAAGPGGGGAAMTVEQARRAYAEEIRAVAHLTSPGLVAALARVPRERFLGPGPWKIAQPFDPKNPYRMTPDDRAEHVYHDVVVAIDPARNLNNGQPSALACWMDAVAPRPGESILHLGCGTGYYSAVLAEQVGPSGRVLAVEIDAELAGRARAGLQAWPQVQVQAGDGATVAGPFDVIFINAGATHAHPAWLAALAPGGRLLLPLTVRIPDFPHPVGFVLAAERQEPRWPARPVSSVSIFDCAGARDPEGEAALSALLAPGQVNKIAALVVDPHPCGDACLAHRPGFCLQS
jgi:protein-L-isoaspartate(D-aspartate) O-methyltransferase